MVEGAKEFGALEQELIDPLFNALRVVLELAVPPAGEALVVLEGVHRTAERTTLKVFDRDSAVCYPGSRNVPHATLSLSAVRRRSLQGRTLEAMSFDPSARVLRFDLGSDEAVGCDRQGRRVVAYAEGVGAVRRTGFPTCSEFYADGVLVSGDPILFRRELKVLAASGAVSGEVRLGEEEGSDFAAVELDRFDFSDERERARRGVRVQNLAARYEVEGESFIEHLGPAQWDVTLPPDTLGVRLNKRFDRFFANQRARVSVDGSVVGIWLEPGGDRVRRRANGSFGFSLARPEGGVVRLEIDPPAGGSLWSVGEVTVAAFTAIR